ncbi:MAG: hypothetical protein LBT59_10150 [Clostridiales bacterium]|nr:hypothetical protein [Clostridiales bacterium]
MTNTYFNEVFDSGVAVGEKRGAKKAWDEAKREFGKSLLRIYQPDYVLLKIGYSLPEIDALKAELGAELELVELF